jgi:hypothetical protein
VDENFVVDKVVGISSSHCLHLPWLWCNGNPSISQPLSMLALLTASMALLCTSYCRPL